MAIQLTQVDINTDLVSNLVTKTNNHMDVTSEIIGRVTGDTGTKSIKINQTSNQALGSYSIVAGQSNILNSSATRSIMAGSGVYLSGTTNAIATGTNYTASTAHSNCIIGNSVVAMNGTFVFQQVGASNNVMGQATLSSGTVTIPNDLWVSNSTSFVFIQHQTISGTPGFLYVDSGASGAGSLVINSTSASDNSTIIWWLVRKL